MEKLSLCKKLFQIQKMNLTVEKDAKNPFYKSSYITLDNLVSVLSPILNELGLLVIHYTQDRSIITSVIDVDSGEQITSAFPLLETNEPQKLGSAISYGKRYNLGQLFNIITDRDDDANATVSETEQTLNKPKFIGKNLKNLVDQMKRGERDKSLEETLEVIRKSYYLEDDMEANIQEYFSSMKNE